MIKAVICDLGKVLLDFDHMQSCLAVEKLCGKPPQEIYDMMFKSGLEKDYDLGRVSSRQFGNRVIDLFDLKTSLHEVQRIWQDIFSPMEGMEELIRSLREKYRLVLLSNTNDWHFEYCRKTYPVVDLFHAHALSYDLGFCKPDPAIYRHALALAETEPGETVYIDDIPEYIAVAQGLGIHSIRFQSAEQLKPALHALGIRV